jgi:hypothetical protein
MDISKYLNVYGTSKFSILLYLVSTSDNSIGFSEMSPPRLTLVKHYLCKYPSKNRLFLVEITCESYTDALTWVKAILARVEQEKTLLAWCMFDGAFGSCGDCFGEWQRQQIYAIYSADLGGKYCFNKETLLSGSWQEILLQGEQVFKGLM